MPHGLRHTAASPASGSGASIEDVRSIPGHASAAMTLDRYGHLFGDELDAVAERGDAARADRMRTEGLRPGWPRSAHRADQCADQQLHWCPRQDSNLRHTV